MQIAAIGIATTVQNLSRHTEAHLQMIASISNRVRYTYHMLNDEICFMVANS